MLLLTLGFHDAPVADLGEKRHLLRYNLMKEENERYLEAVQNNDLVEIADALKGYVYIVWNYYSLWITR
jgi:hypothetical protein